MLALWVKYLWYRVVPDTTSPPKLRFRLEYSISAGFVKGDYLVTYPPDLLPLLSIKGRGSIGKREAKPLSKISPPN